MNSAIAKLQIENITELYKKQTFANFFPINKKFSSKFVYRNTQCQFTFTE
ncbi:MAG: hypothetical protein CH6_4185 [Candidatus Kapaibacterium sp.]|nr:MAG: hypothetical protein CH6_4185 [Candidatus Kapabacteria bacterium]